MKTKTCKLSTLGELSTENHTYWKFSQSMPGLSAEPEIYLPYKENEFAYAEDYDKLLSFVKEENIAKCYMYGDQLTKLCFDNKNPKFQEIQDNNYTFIGGSLGEYETSVLLVEKIYSLKDKATIRLLASMIPERTSVWTTGWFSTSFYGSFEERLNNYGFKESATLLSKIGRLAQKNMHMNKEELLDFIDNY